MPIAILCCTVYLMNSYFYIFQLFRNLKDCKLSIKLSLLLNHSFKSAKKLFISVSQLVFRFISMFVFRKLKKGLEPLMYILMVEHFFEIKIKILPNLLIEWLCKIKKRVTNCEQMLLILECRSWKNSSCYF